MILKKRQRGFCADRFCSIGIGGAILGGAALGAVGSYFGAKKSKDASDDAIDWQKEQYQQTRQDLEPWRTSGVNALNRYTSGIENQTPMYGSFEGGNRFNWDNEELYNDPGYNFVRGEALRGTERQQNAGGNQWSGGLLTALQDRAGGLAAGYSNQFRTNALNENNINYGRDTGEYGMGVARNTDIYGRNQDYLNRLNALSGGGQNAAAQLGGFGSEAASNMGNIGMQNAMNQSNAVMSGANTINNALQSYNTNNMLDRYLGGGSAPNSNFNPYDNSINGWTNTVGR